MVNVLYIHGMGGGADSRIPSILNEALDSEKIRIVTRTYDFNPEIGGQEIRKWVKELAPVLIIGESLGSLQALQIPGIPHILVSPSLNAPIYFRILAILALLPGVTRIFDKIYKPKEGERQPLHFTYGNLKNYGKHRKRALATSPYNGGDGSFFAFFGTKDHYRRTGIVSVRTWKKYFGNSFYIYEGTHFMEEEHVRSILVDKILEVIETQK